MNFELTEEQALLQQTVRRFAEEEVAPGAIERDESKIWPEDIVRQLGEMGLMGMMVPDKWGGAGMDTVAYTIAMEEICRADASVGVIMSVNNSLVCSLLHTFGTDDQKDKYLTPLARGEQLGAFSLSEPQAGSDASNLLCRAERDGDGYRVSGTKNWVSNGQHSDVVLLFALTDPEKKHKGISCFIVEKGWSGFSVGKPEDKLGIRASDTTELYLDEVKVPVENRIGGEGDGFRIALATLDGGRIGIAAQALGIAQAALDHALAYAQEREQFGHQIVDFQAIQFKLADMATEVEAARLLVRRAAFVKDRGDSASSAAAMAKVFASEAAMKAATQCVQIHGGYGYMRETGVERLMRDAKITQIYEGTSEIQRVVIARELQRKG
ncbi:MAG: acyl-CoA dehydrogenase [Fidelibacterota bacterium]|nr:MAG: acyl-CoA dehydrogenase [Candidatus Neomarinimicrobiota bacterium]